MPELPEVETVITGLKPVMLEKTIDHIETHRDGLRYPFPTNLDKITSNVEIIGMQRLSKYILIRLDNGTTLISHLGMSGKYTIQNKGNNDPLQKHDHLIIHMKSGQKIIYNDPRRFGFMISCKTSEEKNERHLSKLGIDPTGSKLTPDYLQNAFKSSRTVIKSALLNQSIIAGLGNIYVCEALFRSKINPETVVSTISTNKIKTLNGHIKNVISEAIESGGSSLKNYRNADGAMGYFQHTFAVYGRDGDSCNTCKTEIKRITQSGRSTFYCPNCQK